MRWKMNKKEIIKEVLKHHIVKNYLNSCKEKEFYTDLTRGIIKLAVDLAFKEKDKEIKELKKKLQEERELTYSWRDILWNLKKYLKEGKL